VPTWAANSSPKLPSNNEHRNSTLHGVYTASKSCWYPKGSSALATSLILSRNSSHPSHFSLIPNLVFWHQELQHLQMMSSIHQQLDRVQFVVCCETDWSPFRWWYFLLQWLLLLLRERGNTFSIPMMLTSLRTSTCYNFLNCPFCHLWFSVHRMEF